MRITYMKGQNMKTSIKIAGMMCMLGVLGVSPAFAVGPRVMMREVREEVRENMASRPGFMNKVLSMKGRAAVGQATLSTKSGTTLTVTTKDGKTYTVNTDTSTQFRRRFWGKSSLDEMTVGDTLDIIGQWTDDAHTSILAKLVRDTSIQKRFGVFFGTVTSVSSTGWVVQTINRGSQTVTVTGSTKFINRKGSAITQADIVVGHKVRVRGLWDNKSNTITGVTEAKDFTLPVVSATPTPTP